MKYKKGFTLVELLISMALYSIILTVLLTLFATILEVRLSAEGSSSVEQDGKYILSRMIHDIPSATSITTPASSGDQTTTLVFSNGASTYTYALINGNLTLDDGSSSQNLNGFNTSISNLTFTRLGGVTGKPTVKITFRVNSKTIIGNRNEIRDFNTTLGLR